MKRLIEKFIIWWTVREWDMLVNESMSAARKETVLANLSAVEGFRALMRLMIRREIKYIAMNSENEGDRNLARGKILMCQSLVRATDAIEQKFKRLGPEDEMLFDE